MRLDTVEYIGKVATVTLEEGGLMVVRFQQGNGALSGQTLAPEYPATAAALGACGAVAESLLVAPALAAPDVAGSVAPSIAALAGADTGAGAWPAPAGRRRWRAAAASAVRPANS